MMNKQITDEMTGIGYTLQDSYYLPDFALPAEGEQSIGVSAKIHLGHLDA